MARITTLSDAKAAAGGPVWAAQLFLLCLIIPVNIEVGSIILMPHRILLVVLFFPFFLKLFVFRTSGPIIASDWLLLGAAIWGGAALMANHGFAFSVQPAGIIMVELFGAYLLARVAIRSSQDMQKMIWTFLIILAVLLPFAALESILRRPVLLELLPSVGANPVDAGTRMGLRRAQAIFPHPILFGAFASTGLGLFWYALRPRGLRFLAAPVSVVTTFFSLSAGALLSIVVQSIFIGWETTLKTLQARWRIFTFLAVSFYILIDLLSNRSPFHVLVTYATFTTGSAYNRIRIWEFGMDNVWANPIFGLGLNDWERPSWMVGSIDNFWLLMAMRYGIPTFLMLFFALVIILRRVSKAELPNVHDARVRAGYLVSFGGLVIAGGTVHYWHAMMAFALFIIGSGVWAATNGGAKEAAREPEAAPERASPYTRQPKFGQPVSVGARSRPVAGRSTARPPKSGTRRQPVSRTSR